MLNYTPVRDAIYIGRKTTGGHSVHERFRPIDMNDELTAIKSQNLTLLGYACDEGVRRNKGRVGAKDGPDHIRRQWAKLPWHQSRIEIFDAGTIGCEHNDLEATHVALGNSVYRLLQGGYFPVLIGGGHDMTWGHFLGIHQHLSGKHSLGIINIDAHLDLRVPNKKGNSGTPFYQIREHLHSDGQDFKYACFGMRRDANLPELIGRAQEWNTLIVVRDNFHIGNWHPIQSQLESFAGEVDRILLTIDMDGFSSAFAPGVSAASPLGFSPDIVMRCIDFLARTGKVISMDIAETNPQFDRDNQTAKLAASLIHHFGDVSGSL